MDQSNRLANQKQVLGFAVPFTSLRILCKNAGLKPFCSAKVVVQYTFGVGLTTLDLLRNT
jgi:hypothetical protein